MGQNCKSYTLALAAATGMKKINAFNTPTNSLRAFDTRIESPSAISLTSGELDALNVYLSAVGSSHYLLLLDEVQRKILYALTKVVVYLRYGCFLPPHSFAFPP